MFKLILNILLVGVSVWIFMMPTYGISAKYNAVKEIQKETKEYKEANDNATKLTAQRDELQKKYASFSETDRARLDLLLPDSIDSIRFVLEIERILQKQGMPLKNVRYSANKDGPTIPNGAIQIGAKESLYGVYTFEFTTEGSFKDLILLLQRMEKSLRLLDVSSVSFSSIEGKSTEQLEDHYIFQVKLNTYWLK